MRRTNRLEFGEGPDQDPAYQWDTKCKLFSLVEVCALPSVVLVGYEVDFIEFASAHWLNSVT